MQSRCFLIAALIVQTLNITNVKAMEPLLPDLRQGYGEASCPEGFQLRQGFRLRQGFDGHVDGQVEGQEITSAFESPLKLDPEMLFKTFTLLQLLPNDVCTLILQDLCYLYMLPVLSTYLKENKTNPEAVLNLIGQSFKKYGYGVSVSLLKIALADAQMCIGSIVQEAIANCLKIICIKEERDVYDLDCIRIILCVAGDKVPNLIALLDDSTSYPAWPCAVFNGHNEIVDIFINWAVAKNIIKALLSIKLAEGSTALHAAAFTGRAGILKKLLALADKYGIVEELINAKNDYGNTALDDANRHLDADTREEMIGIIEEYIAKSKFARMSLN